ncbi:MAG: uroporphyrinogen decarboxylase [Thermoplasmata archaeon]
MNHRERFLGALRSEPVDELPIWLMRQAGRHLPGYRRLRAEHGILEIVTTPELAAEVTLEPVERYDLDAGVVFADITVPFFGLGVDFGIDAGVGPVVAHPVRDRAGVEGLREFDGVRDAGFVGEAIRRFKGARPDLPIVGFAGAPFTLAAYLVDGRPSRDHEETKRLLFAERATFVALLDRLTEATIRYLSMQAAAGADALQLFDTWAGALSRNDFEREVLPRLRTIFDALEPTGCPTIYFSTASAHLLELAARCGASALGVDARLSLDHVRSLAGPRVALQGNLDPMALCTDPETVVRMAREVLDALPDGRGHVFNLGHGVPPDGRSDCVEALVRFVHEYSRRRTSR